MKHCILKNYLTNQFFIDSFHVICNTFQTSTSKTFKRVLITLKNFFTIPILLIGMLLYVTGCGPEKSEGYSFIASDVEFGEDDYQKIVESNNKLGFNLVTKVDPNEQNNIFISPTSLMMALSMAYNGADGKTKEEIARALQVEGISIDDLNKANASLVTNLYKDTNQVTINVANSIWLNKDFHFQETFTQNNHDYYNANIQEIDIFDRQSVKLINDWVKEATNDKIDKIVKEPLDENILAFLINAIYFKGQWTYAFDKNKTEVGSFHLPDGTTKDVSLMNLQEDLLYFDTGYFQAVKLPYGNGEMSMNIFLPNENTTLKQLIEMLTIEDWNKWMTAFSEKEGTIILPKFKLTYETSLNHALMELGMKEAFDENHANFSNMIKEDEQIYISHVKQKTFIEVNEEGTEAAATTSVELKNTSAPVDGPFYMEVNRPFLFTINDEDTDTIVFMGSISNPQDED